MRPPPSPLPPRVVFSVVVVSLQPFLLLIALWLLMNPLDIVIQTSGDDVSSFLV